MNAAALHRLGLGRGIVINAYGTDRIPLIAAAECKSSALAGTPVVGIPLFIGGDTVPRRYVEPALDLDRDRAFVELVGGDVRARVAILPVGPECFVVCDRLDAHDDHQLVCWPDDSSYHLAAAIPPARHARWLDLGTGSAFAPLARPGAATAIVGIDLNPRAVELARHGLALSGIRHAEVHTAGIDDALGTDFDLVTCNAPIPATRGPLWRATAPDFIVRAVAAARTALVPGGTFVIHAALAALEPALSAQRGERVVVAYTPADAERGFAVAWWRPDGEDRLVLARRALDADRPHLDHTDRDAARAGTLPAL